jgi:[acyl-carrier-protein] S-malonyltransferase
MVHKQDLAPGSVITAGAHVATVRGRRDEHPVRAVHEGTVVEWLVEEGDPVSPGQPLLRLVPAMQTAAAQQ